jgi:hypothetical protein
MDREEAQSYAMHSAMSSKVGGARHFHNPILRQSFAVQGQIMDGLENQPIV